MRFDRDVAYLNIGTFVLTECITFFVTKRSCTNKSTNSYKSCCIKKGFLKNFSKIRGKHLCWSLFLIKLQGWGMQLHQKEAWTKVFVISINIEMFLRTAFLQNNSGRLLLHVLVLQNVNVFSIWKQYVLIDVLSLSF